MSPDLVLFVFTIWVENNFLLNTCLLLQVYGWGRGEHGRMGFGDNDKSSKMVPQKVNLLAGEDIIQVSSTYAFGTLGNSYLRFLYKTKFWPWQPKLAVPFVCHVCIGL